MVGKRKLLLMFGLVVCISSLDTAGSEVKLGTNVRAWTERLLPLPKDVQVTGSVTAALRDIALAPCRLNSSRIRSARGLLAPVAGCETPAPRVMIAMERLADADIPNALKHRLARAPNGEQAYAIHIAPAQAGAPVKITMAAATDVGLLYAAQTLRQLLKLPAQAGPDTVVEIPIAAIADWPDLGRRGFFGVPGEQMIDHCAEFKLNVSMIGGGCRLDAAGKPLVTDSSELVAKGAALNVRLIPELAHLDTIAESVLKPALFREQWQHLLPVFMTDAEGKKSQHCVCFSSAATLELLTQWLLALATQTQGSHSDLFVFLTEQPRDTCHCPSCSASGKSHYELEMTALGQAVAAVRETFPDTVLIIGMTQAVRLKNATRQVMDALPPNASLVYYDGEETYVTDRQPMIPPVYAEFVRNGGSLGVVPQISFHFRNVLPMHSPQFLQFRMREFVDKGLDGVYSYAPPRAFTALLYKPAVVAQAEYSWNAHGRAPADFARAYATVTGICEPGLFSSWVERAGEAAYTLAESNFHARLFIDPSMGFYGAVPLDHLLEHSRIHDIPDLDRVVATAEEALDIARQAGQADLINESEFVHAGLTMFRLLKALSPLIHGDRTDAESRAEAARYLDQLDACAHGIRVALFDWADRLTTTSVRYMNQRFMNTVLAPLRTCDTMRNVCNAIGISDPRPDSRIRPLGEWTVRDFSKSTASLRFDITDAVDARGGLVHVTFDYLEGENVIIREVALLRGNPDEPAALTLLAISPDAGRGPYPRPRSTGGLFTGVRLRIPAAQQGDARLLLRVRMGTFMTAGRAFPEEMPPQAQRCAGLVGIRRVYERGEFPDAVASRALGDTPDEQQDPWSPWRRRPRQQGDELRVAVSKGYGADVLTAVLDREERMSATALDQLSKPALEACDVLIVCQKVQPIRLRQAAPMIVSWVRNGGGVMFTHDAVGFRQHMAMFRTIGGGTILRRATPVRSVLEHPLTKGLPREQPFWPSYRYDHIAVQSGPAGTTVLRSGAEHGRPVVVAGRVGRGKVVLNGMLPGLSSTEQVPRPQEAEPAGQELQLLINSVQWLAVHD